jgi:hypothetical protein
MEHSERCPLCRQPITRREYEAIEKRIRKEERVRVAASEARARRELREEHQRGCWWTRRPGSTARRRPAPAS